MMPHGDNRPVRGLARVPGRHWVSDFNFRPEVTEAFAFPAPLALIDSTIRKVVYTAGVHPHAGDILSVCEVLGELGIKDESLNLWFWGEAQPNGIEHDVVRAVAGGGFGFRLTVFVDTLVGDGRTPQPHMRRTVDMLAGLGVDLLSPGLRQAPDKAAEQRQAEDFAAFAACAAEAGRGWTLTVANCGRRDFDGMVRACNVAIACGVQRLDLMDSTSTLSPEAMKLFLRSFRARLSAYVPITMHTHDDFGLATASTIAAVTAGASPDVALNGVSYRSGFAALEEVVLALDVLYGLDTGIRLDRLQWASDRLARMMGLPVHPLKPVVGAHQFLRETPGDVLHLLDSGMEGALPPGQSVEPRVTGGRMTWVWGKQSSEAVLFALAETLGLRLDAAQARMIKLELDRRLLDRIAYPKWIEAAEVEDLITRVAGSGSRHANASATG